MTVIAPGDELQFDDKKAKWLVRGTAKNGIALATRSQRGQVLYTLVDQAQGVRGAMNVIGGGLGIETTSGEDPDVAAAIRMIDEDGFEISHRNRVPLNITKHVRGQP